MADEREVNTRPFEQMTFAELELRVAAEIIAKYGDNWTPAAILAQETGGEVFYCGACQKHFAMEEHSHHDGIHDWCKSCHECRMRGLFGDGEAPESFHCCACFEEKHVSLWGHIDEGGGVWCIPCEEGRLAAQIAEYEEEQARAEREDSPTSEDI